MSTAKLLSMAIQDKDEYARCLVRVNKVFEEKGHGVEAQLLAAHEYCLSSDETIRQWGRFLKSALNIANEVFDSKSGRTHYLAVAAAGSVLSACLSSLKEEGQAVMFPVFAEFALSSMTENTNIGVECVMTEADLPDPKEMH